MYIDKIEIQNLRCFAKTSVEFAHPAREAPAQGPPNVTLLLGDNGSGKSTALKAIAYAVLAPSLKEAGYLPYSLVRRTGAAAKPQKASVKGTLHVPKTEIKLPSTKITAVTSLSARSGTRQDKLDSFKVTPATASRAYERALDGQEIRQLFMVAYGSRRFTELAKRSDKSARDAMRLPRYQRVASLLDDTSSFTLVGPDAWLPEFRLRNRGRFAQVVQILSSLSPPDDKKQFEIDEAQLRKNGELVFRQFGAQVPFHALSDGFRGFFGWITDFLYHIVDGVPPGKKLNETEGIVLVDEIDLLLHPSWQRQVVHQLSTTFPKLQFVFTTHSPLVAGGLSNAQIRVMSRAADGRTMDIQVPSVNLYGKSADQILLSPVFDLQSVRTPFEEERINTLALKSSTGDGEATRELMRLLAGETTT